MRPPPRPTASRSIGTAMPTNVPFLTSPPYGAIAARVNRPRFRRRAGGYQPSMSARSGYQRDSFTWMAFAVLGGFGILNAALGPALPYLRSAEGISYAVASLHQV